MATVRIYKVAELLGIPSQRVVELLKRDHGIEVKSASSTIEEVVARQFAERVSRQLEVTLPSGATFADTPASRTKGKKAAAKGPEPAKPAAPALGPPRLVKAIKPPPPPETEAPPSEGRPRRPKRRPRRPKRRRRANPKRRPLSRLWRHRRRSQSPYRRHRQSRRNPHRRSPLGQDGSCRQPCGSGSRATKPGRRRCRRRLLGPAHPLPLHARFDLRCRPRHP